MLSDKGMAALKREIEKYPPGKQASAVMAALHLIQDEQGWVSPEAMRWVAEALAMPAVAVEEVATFYARYRTSHPGRYHISVCTNLPCQLSGGQDFYERLCRHLGVKNGKSADGAVTVEACECMGACVEAPLALINSQVMLGRQNPEDMEAFMSEVGKIPPFPWKEDGR